MEYINTRDFHSRVYDRLLELVPAGRTITHRHHAMTLRALETSNSVVGVLVDGLQLALTHAAEADLLVAVAARDTPVGAGVAQPLLGVTQLGNGAVITRLVDLGIDAVKGDCVVAIYAGQREGGLRLRKVDGG